MVEDGEAGERKRVVVQVNVGQGVEIAFEQVDLYEDFQGEADRRGIENFAAVVGSAAPDGPSDGAEGGKEEGGMEQVLLENQGRVFHDQHHGLG